MVHYEKLEVLSRKTESWENTKAIFNDLPTSLKGVGFNLFLLNVLVKTALNIIQELQETQKGQACLVAFYQTIHSNVLSCYSGRCWLGFRWLKLETSALLWHKAWLWMSFHCRWFVYIQPLLRLLWQETAVFCDTSSSWIPPLTTFSLVLCFTSSLVPVIIYLKIEMFTISSWKWKCQNVN